jgi:predicted MPP superfamily phosphohydrolase
MINRKNSPSLTYNHHSEILKNLGLKPGKIYITSNHDTAIPNVSKIRNDHSSRRINSMLAKLHELSESTSKQSLGKFMAHSSPDVIINENNILSTLVKDNPTMGKSIETVKKQYGAVSNMDPAREYISNYVKLLNPQSSYGNVKIPKAMRRHISKKWHEQQKLVLGTE